MANPTWPATLPAPQAENSTAYAGVSNIVRTDMEAGVAKQRRRFTAVAEPFTCTLKLSQAQWITLEAFYRVTLQSALPFDWIDFRSGAVATYRFMEKGPSASYIKGSVDRWLVTMALEKLP